MYNSLYSVTSECIKCQVATLLTSPSSHICLKFVDVQMQSGTYDCGLFSVAFAMALALGSNPGQYFFDQRAMRKLLWKLMFPVTKERRRK